MQRHLVPIPSPPRWRWPRPRPETRARSFACQASGSTNRLKARVESPYSDRRVQNSSLVVGLKIPLHR